MGILTRFKDIMSANINSLLDKCENPSKMIDEYMRQAVEQLAEVKEETAEVMAEEKRTKRDLDENSKEIEKYEDLAKKALVAGNEGDARVFIEKKQGYESLQADLQKAYDIARDNAVKMRDMHDKLTKDIQTLEQRRQNVKSKVAVAETQEKLNKINESMDIASESMQAFEKMEKKADKMLDEANAMAELSEKPVDSAEEIEEKYSTSSKSVDDELEELKKKMGM